MVMATRPPPLDDGVHDRMSVQKTRNTDPELAIRSELHRRGLRYRVHQRPLASLRREADLVIRKYKLALFVDGCFWHGCPEHGTWPRNNAEFWRSKIEKNIERDRDTDSALDRAGWTVIRSWEHEDAAEVAERVMQAVERLRH